MNEKCIISKAIVCSAVCAGISVGVSVDGVHLTLLLRTAECSLSILCGALPCSTTAQLTSLCAKYFKLQCTVISLLHFTCFFKLRILWRTVCFLTIY